MSVQEPHLNDLPSYYAEPDEIEAFFNPPKPDPKPHEFNVTQVTIPQDGRRTAFVLRTLPNISYDAVKRVAECWQHAWGAEPPSLLVLTTEMELTALTDVQLTNCGLMRIPTE